VAALATLVLLTVIVPAATADDLDDDLSEVRSRIDSLSDQIDSAAASRSSLARDVKAAKTRMDEALSALDALRDDLALVRSRLVVKEQALRESRAQLHEQYQVLALTRTELAGARTDATDWAVETYMSAGAGVPEVAFSATAWNEVTVGIEYLDRVTESGVAAVARFETLLADEESTGAAIEAAEAALVGEVASLEETRAELEQFEDELEAKSEELRAEVERQRALLVRVEAEIAELEGTLAALEKEEDGIRSLIAARSSSGGRAPGQLVRPVPGVIESGFGPRFHPILGYSRMHNGLDMHCESGDAIVAAEAGTVILAGTKGGFGKTIMIDHGGGMVTLYAHQSGYAVSTGDSVGAGQVVGYCGSTGLSTGPHLHFEVRINGNPVNPANYL
jgi:murein DD-endopeptidase MepM/ murein hydrolase activator NlpD